MEFDIEKFRDEFVKKCGDPIEPGGGAYKKPEPQPVPNNEEELMNYDFGKEYGYPWPYNDTSNYMVTKAYGNCILVFLYNPSKSFYSSINKSKEFKHENAELAVCIEYKNSYSPLSAIEFNGITSKHPFSLFYKPEASFKVNKSLISQQQLDYVSKTAEKINQHGIQHKELSLFLIVYSSDSELNTITLLKARNNDYLESYRTDQTVTVNKKEIEHNFYNYVFTNEQIENYIQNVSSSSHDKSVLNSAKLQASSFIQKYKIDTFLLLGRDLVKINDDLNLIK